LIREISEEYGFEIEEMEVAEDHVPILISFSPKRSIGEVVRTIKEHKCERIVPRVPAD
jgi:putative transposase